MSRFIPACAGNSWSVRCARWRLTVHPRVCGEQDLAEALTQAADGSSPRVRGTVGDRGIRAVQHRFIPACAGNSPVGRWAAISRPVHPRVCGEQDELPAARAVMAGSSPRVRGTEAAPVLPEHRERFIPACAGNRAAAARRHSTPAVHPRVCGEQPPVPVGRVPCAGSSPRVRGTACCPCR